MPTLLLSGSYFECGMIRFAGLENGAQRRKDAKSLSSAEPEQPAAVSTDLPSSQ